MSLPTWGQTEQRVLSGSASLGSRTSRSSSLGRTPEITDFLRRFGSRVFLPSLPVHGIRAVLLDHGLK